MEISQVLMVSKESDGMGSSLELMSPMVEGTNDGKQLMIIVLRGLRNQISSSAHSSVVRGHVELRTLGSFTSGDKKSMRLKSY